MRAHSFDVLDAIALKVHLEGGHKVWIIVVGMRHDIVKEQRLTDVRLADLEQSILAAELPVHHLPRHRLRVVEHHPAGQHKVVVHAARVMSQQPGGRILKSVR